ncbi:MAG: iron ABC transporter permease [candidate division WOR-3 bacterium]
MRKSAIFILVFLSMVSEIFVGRVFGYEILVLRILRLFLGISAGLGLGVVGAVLQRVYRNPLADGYILGISGGAIFGVAISEYLKLPMPFYTTSLIFSLLVSLIIILVSPKVHEWMLPVIGIGMGMFFSSVAIMFFIMAGAESTRTLYALWGSLGRFFSISDIAIVITVFIFTLALSLLLILKNREFDATSLGNLEALCLGYDPKLITVYATLLSSLIVAVLTSYAGIIGFVGIMAPHMVRILGYREGWQFYAFSGMLGIAFVLLGDSLGRLIFGIDPPIGVIMGIIGSPFFIYLVLKEGKG